jgi:hypothetical protein
MTDYDKRATRYAMLQYDNQTLRQEHDTVSRRYDSNKTAKIKQNQANSERGPVLARPITPDEMKSANSKNQAKSNR